MRKGTFTILTATLFCIAASARGAEPVEATAADEKPYHPFSLRLEAGSTGAGGAVGWRFLDHLGVRAGGDYFEYTDTREIEGIDYHNTLRVPSEPLTLDIYPWKKHSFHISVGIAFNQSELKGSATPSGNVTIGGNTYTPGQIGTLNLSVKQQPVNPYLSIGGNFFYFDKAHHWAFGGELGVMYTGDGRVSLSSSNGGVSQSDLDSERQQIRDKINDYKFWPVLKLAVTYSF